MFQVRFFLIAEKKKKHKLDRTDIDSSISYMIKNIPLNWYTSNRIPEGSLSYELFLFWHMHFLAGGCWLLYYF